MKSVEQFAADITAGNAWEMRLWGELSQWIYGLERPEEVERVGDRVIGGFGYSPDMKIKTMVHLSDADSKRYWGAQASIEAKIRLSDGFTFTCADDFPYDTIIVNEVYKTAPMDISGDDYLRMPIDEQKARMRPFHSYWMASTDQKHVAVILPATKPLWTHKTLFSPKDRRATLNWMCPIRKPNGGPAVLFGKFPEDVKRLLTYL